MNLIQFKKISKETFYKNIEVISDHYWKSTVGYYIDNKDCLSKEEQDELLDYFSKYAENLKCLETILLKYKPIG